MGARTQIAIQMYDDSRVYLYSHWGSDRLKQIVYEGLLFAQKNGRLTDNEYLARIMFDCMKGCDIDTSTGYGIGTTLHGDLDNWCFIDVKGQKVYFYPQHDDTYSEEHTIEQFLSYVDLSNAPYSC